MTGTDGTSALTGEKQAFTEVPTPARGGGARRAILAAAAASLVTGAAVWALTRGASTPDEAHAAVAIPSASDLVAATIAPAAAPPPPTATPSASASAAPSSRPGPSKPRAAAPRAGTPASKYNTVSTACGGTHCTDPAYQSQINAGKTLDTVANIGLGAGLAGLAAGTLMIVFGGAHEPPVAVTASPDGARLLMHGRFQSTRLDAGVAAERAARPRS